MLERSRAVVVAACAALFACAGGGGGEGEQAAPGNAEAGARAGTAGSSAAGAASSAANAGKGGADSAGAAGMADMMTLAGTGGGSSGSAGSTHVGGTTPGSSLPPPDPSVSFDWPATLPGGDDDCRPGHYDGTFSCEYRMLPTDVDPLVVVDGPISLTLERSQDGEFLEISDGQLDGIAQFVIGFRAKLSGKLDCATHQLTADAVDGLYGFGDPAALPFGSFMGTLTGTLDTTTGTLDGGWDLAVDPASGGGACVGPWQANWAP